MQAAPKQRAQEVKHEQCQVFPSGPEFFDDLLNELSRAKNFIVIKSFLWRNDRTGQKIAEGLMQAAERGVRVLIVKDRMGAFFEYSEAEGQSFFHNNPQKDSPYYGTHSLRSIYAQSRAMAYFYGNRPRQIEANPLAEEMRSHPQIEVIDQFKLYDHSKVVAIDGEVSYLGGIGFADEFCSEDDECWVDFMLKISDAELSQALIAAISGEEGAPFHAGCMHQNILNFVRETRVLLQIEMAFLGEPGHINALTEMMFSGASTQLFIPQKASSHNFRNHHFVKRLMRQVRNVRERLSVFLVPAMTHSKLLIRDDEAVFFGSANLSMDPNVMSETNIEVVDPKLAAQFRLALQEHREVARELEKSMPWHKILLQSRLEYLAIKIQKIMALFRRKQISQARKLCQSRIKEIAS